MKQVALAWSPATEQELIARGFRKVEVYVREWPGQGTTAIEVRNADADMFAMVNPPYQFLCASCWGAGPDD